MKIFLKQSKLYLIGVLLSTAGFAETIYISPSEDPYTEIQEALILANPGDVVHLSSGLYELEDSLSIDIKNIILEGEGINETVLSFKNQLSGAQGLLVTSDNVILRDFAIENAKGEGSRWN